MNKMYLKKIKFKLSNLFPRVYKYFFGKVELVSLKKNVVVGKGNMIFPGGLSIKAGGEKVKIGNYCAFGNNIKLFAKNHNLGYPATQHFFYKKNFGKVPKNASISKGMIEIGSDVRIGDNTIILSGVKIGNGACIGAGSIVTKDIEAFSINGGVPAKKIKMRFEEKIINFLNKITWRKWNDKKIKKNKEFFLLDLNRIDIKEIDIKE